jgi:hypothetical protein
MSFLVPFSTLLETWLNVKNESVHVQLLALATSYDRKRKISVDVSIGGMTMPPKVTAAILAVCYRQDDAPTIQQFRKLLQEELPASNEDNNDDLDNDNNDDLDNDIDDKCVNKHHPTTNARSSDSSDSSDDTLVFDCFTAHAYAQMCGLQRHSPQLFDSTTLARLKADQEAYTQMDAGVSLSGVLGRLVVREVPEIQNGTPAPLTFSQPLVYDFLPDAVVLRTVPRKWRRVRFVQQVPSDADREAMCRRQVRVDPAIPAHDSPPPIVVRVDAADDGTLADNELCDMRLARLERYLRFVSAGESVYRGSFVRSADVERFRAALTTNLIGVGPIVTCIDGFFDLFTDDDGTVPRGMLFFGPPGTGKTKIASSVKSMGLVPLCEDLSSSDFRKPLQGMAERMVAELGRRAKLVPWQLTFLSIDEIDGMAAARQGKQGDSGTSTLNKMLSLIEGNQNVRNMVVIGSTNNIGDLDKAFQRRLPFKVFVGPPASDARRQWIEWRTVTHRLKIFCRNHESWRMLCDSGTPAEQQRHWPPHAAAARRAALHSFAFDDELINFVVSLTLNFSNDAMLMLLRKVAVSSAGSRALADVRPAARPAGFQLEQASDWLRTTRAVREAWLHKLVREICESEEILLGSRVLPDIVVDPANRPHGAAAAPDARTLHAFKARLVGACRGAAHGAAAPLVGMRSWAPTGRVLIDLSAAPGEQLQLQVVKTGLAVERDQLELLRVSCDSLGAQVRACRAACRIDMTVNAHNELTGVERGSLAELEALLSTIVGLRTMFHARALCRALSPASAHALAPLRDLVSLATVQDAIDFVSAALEAWRVLSPCLIAVVTSALAAAGVNGPRLHNALTDMLGEPPTEWQAAVAATLTKPPLALIIGHRAGDPDAVAQACVVASGALWSYVNALLLELVAFFDFGRLSSMRHSVEHYGCAPNLLSFDQALFQLTETAREACLGYVALVDHQTMVRRGATDEHAQLNFVSQVLTEARAAHQGALVVVDLDSIAGMQTALATPSSDAAFALMQLNRRDQRIFDPTPSPMTDVGGGNRSFQHVVLREPLKQAVLEAFQHKSLTTSNVWFAVVARDGFLAATVRQTFSSAEWPLRDSERKLLAEHRDSVRVRRCVNCDKEFTRPRNAPDSCTRHAGGELFLHAERPYGATGDDPAKELSHALWRSLDEARTFLCTNAALQRLAPEKRVEVVQRIKWLCCGRSMGEHGCVREAHVARAEDVHLLGDDNDDDDDSDDEGDRQIVGAAADDFERMLDN